jgi:hypothetical protein
MGSTRLLATAAATLALAGCGDAARQDADEPRADFALDVVSASFPTEQTLAEQSTLAIEVRNPSAEEAVPEVAVTIETAARGAGAAPIAFGQRDPDPRLADSDRPVWIVDAPPRGADSAYVNTWRLGRLPAGASHRFQWRVTAVQAGAFRLQYRVAPGLDSKARLAAGSKRPRGSWDVMISGAPPEVRVRADGSFERE